MARMTAGMLAAAKWRKESGSMVAGDFSNQEMLVDSCWDACSSQIWRLMAGMAAGMLAVDKKIKEDEFSWLLRSLQQPREVDFGWANASQFIES
ncbi:hypothetical protein Pyn_38602 [Prunus yedoensis var. nudiflora]|uniref:Uncharacterized protein n=1 Tax=Prunus yedoensis var. nudiflora TaxID=2094558 RepID=A0A314YNM5_PRUYE|nr:hypothetical protein Pyn_38602 [Prunus yedoensis var. nudiflora]